MLPYQRVVDRTTGQIDIQQEAEICCPAGIAKHADVFTIAAIREGNGNMAESHRT
jgi:hypothetical protein